VALMAQARIIRYGPGGAGSVYLDLQFAPTFQEVGESITSMSGAAAVAMLRTLRLLRTKIKSEGVKAAAQASNTPQKYWRHALRVHAALDAVNVRGTTYASGVVTLWMGTNPVPVHRLGRVRWAPRTKTGRRTKGATVNKTTYPGAWSWGRGVTGPAVLQRTSDERLPIKRIDIHPHEAVLERMAALGDEMQQWFERRLREQLRYALDVEAKTPAWGAKARRRIQF
jgi:hypothetical protein